MSRWLRAPLGLAALLLLSGSTCTSNFTEADLAAQERKEMDAAKHEEQLDQELGEQGGANEQSIQEQVDDANQE